MKNRLYNLRQEYELSQEDLAKKLNVLQQKISRYENGNTSKIDADLENSLCDYFNCSLDYMRCRSAIRNEQKYSDNLKRIVSVIEEFYSGSNKKMQDLSDEDLAFFLEFITKFKELFQNFPKQ